MEWWMWDDGASQSVVVDVAVVLGEGEGDEGESVGVEGGEEPEEEEEAVVLMEGSALRTGLLVCVGVRWGG